MRAFYESMSSLLFCLVVSIVTNDQLRINATANSIHVSWSASPPYPSKYVLTCICSLLCDERPVINTVVNVTSKETFAFIIGLLPGSKCNINLTEYGQYMTSNEVTNVVSANAKTAYEGEQLRL